MKILVVDDEKIIALSLERVLKRRSHTVVTANSGIEALLKLEKDGPFDILIMDYLMPELGGAEVLSQCRIKYPELKVIMMTAYGDQLVREELLSRGACLVIHKPFEDILKIPDLLDTLLEST